MAFRALTVLLFTCAATAVLGAESETLQKRGLMGDALDFGGGITKNIIDLAVNGGHLTREMAQSFINYSADTIKSGASYLLRRDMVAPNMNMNMDLDMNLPVPDMSSLVSSMMERSQAGLDSSWRRINQEARNMRNTLPDHGRRMLEMYMKELQVARDAYRTGLQNGMLNAADLSSMMETDPQQWESVQKNYAVEMINYVNQARNIARVMDNNGFNGFEV